MLWFVYDVRGMSTAVKKAPRITQDDAVRIAAEVYGLNVSAAPLPSERDQNFYCKALPRRPHPSRAARLGTPGRASAPTAPRSGDSNEEFVLKIANSEEAFEFLELQNQLIKFITASKIELEFPRIVPTETGENISTIKDENGREHFVRLLT